MVNILSKFEHQIQHIIEENFLKLFPYVSNSHALVNSLIEKMGSTAVVDEQGNTIAPSLYILNYHPSHLPESISDQQISSGLIYALKQAAEVSAIKFDGVPKVIIQKISSLPLGEIHISTTPETSIDETTIIKIKEKKDFLNKDQKAFLIVDGTIYFIETTVFNIGRLLTNNLPIQDPRVSRNHAQIRRIVDQYRIFDLGSTGGTFVNGQSVKEKQLIPGDVISLAGYTFIFGTEENASQVTTKPIPRG